jgi:hypothetical protein
MQHNIEKATSGRSKCRGCGQVIAKDVVRFGEVLPNPFADGTTMTHWFHLRCVSMKRPDPFLDTTEGDNHGIDSDELEQLRATASFGLAHRRVPRIDSAGRAPTGRARCRHCREMIEKDAWRIGLVFYEEGMFNPAGYIHLTCSGEYFETVEIVDRIAHFAPHLAEADLDAIGKELNSEGQHS